MLKLKPNCECCNKDLPPAATDAMICSYECTFCRECNDSVLLNVCPNCGGGLSPRPIRPKKAYRKGVSLEDQPASTEAVHSKFSQQEMTQFAQKLKDVPPHLR